MSPMVPETVIDPEPFAPDVKVRPLVDPNVRLPSLTESVSESMLVPAIWSVSVIALGPEKSSGAFSFVVAADGPDAVGDQLRFELARSGTSRLAIGVPMPLTRS